MQGHGRRTLSQPAEKMRRAATPAESPAGHALQHAAAHAPPARAARGLPGPCRAGAPLCNRHPGPGSQRRRASRVALLSKL